MRAIRFLAWCAVGSFSIGACGGKTQIDGTGGSSGGGSGGTSASGGTSGNGGTAGISGGAAGYGGMAGGGMAGMAGDGGMAGYGGMAGDGGMAGYGGMAGTGATAGTGGGGGTGIWQKADQLCKVIGTLPCAEPGCMKELGGAIMEAQDHGCVSELDKLFDCALKYPLTCQGGDPELNAQCYQTAYAFQECIDGGSNCSGWGGSDGTCGLNCDDFDVSCKPLPGGLQCVCQGGPNAGKMFKLPMTCNSPNWEDAVTANCD